MKRWLFVFLPMFIVSSFVVTSRTNAQDGATLKVAQDPAVGAFLTDAEGMTLYLFTRDTTAGESVCNDDCAVNWPPLAASDDLALPPGVPGELGSIEREDGSMQATYNDIPLYYWINDESPGDITGQEVGGVWFVVPPGAELGPYPEAPGEGTPFPASTVKIGFTEALGPFLTDAEGMTLYLFTNDTTPGESACSGDCAVNWPPVPAGTEMMLPPGIPGELTSIEREDGSTQLAYNDIPLYLWINDQNPGDTTGQGVGDVWYIVPPGMEHGDSPHVGEGTATPTS